MNKVITIGIAIIVSTFIATNAILLFSTNSQLSRSYYVSEYDRVQENTYTKELEKEAVVVPANETTMTIEAALVSDLTVTPGDKIQEGAELAQLKTETADKQRSLWESEQQAYTQEQTQLQQILDSLESDRAGANSTSYGNANTTDDGMDVNVQVEVNVSPEGNFAQAIAQTEQKIAEVDRKLQIVNTQLSQETSELALLSPLEGNVASIEEKNGLYFITIYSDEKSVLTFVNEAEWHEIAEGQKVMNHSAHKEDIIEGTILAKTEVPATQSAWLKAYKQFDNKTKAPLYEVRIQLNDALETLPFAANINSIITTDEAENVVRVNPNWLLNRSKQTAEIYTLTTEGHIVRNPVTVPFDLEQSAILSVGLENEMVVLNAEPKREESRAFLPLPLDLPTWNSIKAVGWKDYIRYLTYK
ncbi:efflux RND transporter periplasmic adaptor subunit [Psychrobacillus glaciei]|uniref:Efflux RND transporter periplasmic adaptor subunit n=1 Tax=Psychrobacillus glaciei TaxID=2283160 RepID=A0A5J6SJA1_9BACI|nr:efflux RND transporter periplasmic adaptor subunit [Psychrobacillus glaciei]QFF97965.1 efflux RND transporter periplasmic adaptor subunit [Psychrobacillus glaciei]